MLLCLEDLRHRDVCMQPYSDETLVFLLPSRTGLALRGLQSARCCRPRFVPLPFIAQYTNRTDGGFAEYVSYPAAKVFKIYNLSDVDATLLEPASCAAHGLDKISPKLGSSVLMFGAGPTGLVLAQSMSLTTSIRTIC